MVCWFSGHVKAKCGIVAFGFDMPTRLIASITLECNDAMTIYVHYLHPFHHIHLNYTNFKRSVSLAEISTLAVKLFHWVLIFQPDQLPISNLY